MQTWKHFSKLYWHIRVATANVTMALIFGEFTGMRFFTQDTGKSNCVALLCDLDRLNGGVRQNHLENSALYVASCAFCAKSHTSLPPHFKIKL